MGTRLARLRRFRPDPLTLDRTLATLLTVGAELQVWLGGGAGHHRLAAALVAPAVTASVALRRRYPTLVGIGVPVLTAFELALWGDPQIVANAVAYFCALYALAVWTPPRRFALGAALIVAVDLAASAGPKGNLHNALPFALVTPLVMLLVRRVVGDRERRAQLAERERDLAAREAVVEERARIARELHDAIAHNVSMMVVQAGAERRVLEGERGPTRDVLETIERIGRGALTEMRRLVGMLRSDAGDPLAPQPGLNDLPTLVTQVREAGLPVELHVDGEPRELPVGIELSAYRIVQEALTNARKHAGEAHASVRVHYGAESLELEIVDDGGGGAAPVSSGGHGLVGMRERVALYGGRLDAGRRPSGGFAVRVLLPIR
ncbi:MAG: sensor histidine kinase [Actinobacteria bacterium]|nr:MAG: sensor histidine kinase [Actinomycetota bacterium]